jgi:hypothetical protein
MQQTSVSKANKKTPAAAVELGEQLKKWNKDLKVETSAEGDSIVASAKYIDVDASDLRKLADIVEDLNWNITFGRSGANFRMIIW